MAMKLIQTDATVRSKTILTTINHSNQTDYYFPYNLAQDRFIIKTIIMQTFFLVLVALTILKTNAATGRFIEPYAHSDTTTPLSTHQPCSQII